LIYISLAKMFILVEEALNF